MLGRPLFPTQLAPAFPVPQTAAPPTATPERPQAHGRARHSRSKKGRRALASFVLAFGVLTVGLSVALDTRLPIVRYPEYGHRLASVQRLRSAHPDRPLALVIGSSRTQMALDPSATGFADEPGEPMVFNFGLTGALPVHHALGYRRLRAAGIKPDAVIVEVFPALLCIHDAAHTSYADFGASLTLAELAALDPDTHEFGPVKQWLTTRTLGLAQYRQALQRETVPDLFPRHYWLLYANRFPDEMGFHAFSSKQISDEDRQRATAKALGAYRFLCQKLPLAPIAERVYRELVAECRADGVPIAFYITPEAPIFHECYTLESRATLAAFVRVFTDELGVPVFDAFDGWQNGDFWDGHHMLPDGAAKFSRRFADQHLRPWFATVLPNRTPSAHAARPSPPKGHPGS